MDTAAGQHSRSRVLRQILVGRVTLAACVVVGGTMALAYSDLLPTAALTVGIPALVVTQLIDTFRIELGTAVWGLIAVLVYLQSVAIGLVYRWFQSRT